MHLSRVLFLLWLLTAWSSVFAKEKASTETDSFNPETTLLSHFSFVRPKHWQWNATKPSTDNDIVTVITFSDEDPSTDGRAVILFNHYRPNVANGNPESTTKRWKTWFTECKETVPANTVTIGTNKVTFLEYTGTYHGPVKAGKKPQLHSNYTFVGAIVEDGDGNIAGRLYGPTSLVQKNKADFRNMLETALKQD